MAFSTAVSKYSISSSKHEIARHASKLCNEMSESICLNGIDPVSH